MTSKLLARRIEPWLRRRGAPSCHGGVSSVLRASRARPRDSGAADSRRPNWLQRAAAYFRTPAAPARPSFGVSEYGVGSTG